MNLHRFALASVATGLAASSLAACGSSDSGTDAPGATVLHVYAASSLKTAFETLGAAFEKSHPGTTVEFNFAGSSDLVAQIQQGAPADVFASADTKNMDKLGTEALDPKNFATNTLAIAVPTDNPAEVDDLADLAAKGIQLVTCAPEVPCGAAAATLETNAKVDWTPVSEEQSVTDVLGKVTSGEADAGLVYVTDVKAAGDKVVGISIDAAIDPVNTYPIAALEGADEPSLATAWITLVTGAEGRKVFAAAGFGEA